MSLSLPEELIFLKNRKVKQKTTKESMEGKVCVITGCTSGVGLETARCLARAKATIVMMCRNLKKATRIKEELQRQYPVSIDIVIADFSNLQQVRAGAEVILKKYPRIDVLINSAGVYSTSKEVTVEGREMVFCVNHLAPFLLTSLLLPRLKESAPARIIQVNSEGHRFNGLNTKDIDWNKRIYTGLRSYGASKVAQLLTVWEFAEKLKGSGVTINAVHPGEVRTNIGANNGVLYRWFLNHVTWHFLKDPSIAGEAIYYLAASKDMEKESGRFYNLTIEEKPAKHALNKTKGKEVWNITMNLTGLGSGGRNEV